MLLLSMSGSLRKAFCITPFRTSAAIPTADWFRFWRCDGFRHKRKDIVFFTNQTTVFTIVVDATRARNLEDLCTKFSDRFFDVFSDFYPDSNFRSEDIQIHSAADRSLIGIMNSLILDTTYSTAVKCDEIEAEVNNTPIIVRGCSTPNELMQHQLNKKYS